MTAGPAGDAVDGCRALAEITRIKRCTAAIVVAPSNRIAPSHYWAVFEPRMVTVPPSVVASTSATCSPDASEIRTWA